MAQPMCSTCGAEIDATSTKTLWIWEGATPPDNGAAARPYCDPKCAVEALQRV